MPSTTSPLRAGPAAPTPARPVPWSRGYRILLGAALRSTGQYRANLLLMLLGIGLMQGTGLAFVGILVTRFGALGDWSFGEIAFLYGMRVCAHAVFTVPFHGLLSIDWVMQRGVFDRFLVRPGGVLTQTLTNRFAPHVTGDLVSGIGILTAAAALTDIDFSPLAVVFLLAAILGGGMVEAAVHLALSSLSFRTLSTRAPRMLFDNLVNDFGGYPLTIFPGPVRFALTFVAPLAFLAYLPATWLLDRTGELSVSPWLAVCAPLAGPLLLGAAFALWRSQLKHYASTGT